MVSCFEEGLYAAIIFEFDKTFKQKTMLRQRRKMVFI